MLRIEFLAAIIVTIILMVWSITLNAPLEEPANPNLTMNPAKAPWYFLGLQEMLVYFDPWIAGVVMPTMIIIGLMVIPYIDTNPLGSGYYTFKQRKFSISTFLFGFIILWVSMIIIGTFIRGPGWQWFWPGQTWDHNRLIYEVNRDLPDIFGITSNMAKAIFGAIVVGGYYLLGGFLVYSLFRRYMAKDFKRMSLLQFGLTQFLLHYNQIVRRVLPDRDGDSDGDVVLGLVGRGVDAAAVEGLPGALERSLQRFPERFTVEIGYFGKGCRKECRLCRPQTSLRKGLSGFESAGR